MKSTYLYRLQGLGFFIVLLLIFSCTKKEKIYQKTIDGDSYEVNYEDLPNAPKADTAFSASDYLSSTKPEVKIIPKPVSLAQQDGSFELTKKGSNHSSHR